MVTATLLLDMRWKRERLALSLSLYGSFVMGTKTEVLRRMRLCGEPILWLHPMSIPFVRVNWESVPIGVAQGQSRVYILNGITLQDQYERLWVKPSYQAKV